MNQNEYQSKERIANQLKEVYEKVEKDNIGSESTPVNNDSPTIEEVTLQNDGSDADMDKGLIHDEQSTSEEVKEQIKGSDSDTN